MNDAGARLRTALHSIVGMPCNLLLATNSIRLRFDFRSDPKGRAYIWIDPPWRLMTENTFLAGSNDYPARGAVEDNEANRSLLAQWCAHFDGLDGSALAQASVRQDYPDLCLCFACGRRIETFSHGGPGCWWYYKDCLSGEVFAAGAAGISYERNEPAGAEPRRDT